MSCSCIVFQKHVLCCALRRSPTETNRQILDSQPQLLNRIAGKSTTVIYPVGNRAWESLCLQKGFDVEPVSHQDKQFTRKREKKSKKETYLVGAQCIDRSWKSLKVQWMGSGVNATTKENGHTLLSPVVSPLVHQWAWRQSIGPKKPKEFLQELERVSPKHFGPRPSVRRVPSWW